MKGLREDLVKIVHGDLNEYTSVLFCGSGTINIDVVINSLLPEGKKVLVVNNGAYSTRAVEICQYYGLPHIDLKFPVDQRPDLAVVEKTLQENPDIALIHTTHNETGTGILNPIREIGALAHKYGAVFTVDTTSTYAMRPINVTRIILISVWQAPRRVLWHLLDCLSLWEERTLSRQARTIQSVLIIAISICSTISSSALERCTSHLQYRLSMPRFRH
jgi:CheY-like chemotaxis protein